MPSSSTWGLLLLAGLSCLVPAALFHKTEQLQHDHEKPNNWIGPYVGDFAYVLYRQVAHQYSTANIFISPLNIAQAFVMLAVGATGETHTQIMETINLDLPGVLKLHIYDHIWFFLNTTQNQMTSSNMLFIDSNLKQELTFLEGVRKLYYSKVFSINFRDTGAQKQINDYVEKETQGKIVDLVKELDKNTSLALVNYVLFKGQWQETFASEPIIGDFHVDEKTIIRVPMTQYFGKFHVLYDKRLSTWVVMRYSMAIPVFLFLPEPGMIQKLEIRLCRRELSRINRGIRKRLATVLLPKLSISGTYDLETFLGKVGITRVFSNKAELSGISKEAPLKLSKALHRAVMTMDENVKKHSGDSLVKNSNPDKHPTIKFNRPFLVYILDKFSVFPLFLGRMVKPMEK